MPTILTIEDDSAIRRGIVDSLRFAGFEVIEAGDGARGLEAAVEREYELLLLDLVLPKISGLEILNRVRQVHPTRPIIILSAKGEENDRVQGLRAGADDYVVKPFGVMELLARIEAVLRRSPTRPLDIAWIRTPRGTVDMIRGEIHCRESTERLTAKEIDVLRYLACNRNRILSRDELLANVWQIDPRNTNTRVIDMTVSRLREKLAPLSGVNDPILMTVHGRGYSLSNSAETIVREPPSPNDVPEPVLAKKSNPGAPA